MTDRRGPGLKVKLLSAPPTPSRDRTSCPGRARKLGAQCRHGGRSLQTQQGPAHLTTRLAGGCHDKDPPSSSWGARPSPSVIQEKPIPMKLRLSLALMAVMAISPAVAHATPAPVTTTATTGTTLPQLVYLDSYKPNAPHDGVAGPVKIGQGTGVTPPGRLLVAEVK